jgi:hypothetical protein
MNVTPTPVVSEAESPRFPETVADCENADPRQVAPDEDGEADEAGYGYGV